MAKSQTSYATNASNNLINQAQGLTDPLMKGFQSQLDTQQQNAGDIYSTVLPALKQNVSTGGYDPTQLSGLRTTVGSNISTGGYDPEKLSSIYGGYSDLATTGGFTPGQENQFLQRATEGTESTYGALQSQAKRASVASGGLGTTGAISQMARQLGQAQSENTLNAEVALNQQKTANKLSGLGGEASVTSDVAGKRLSATGQGIGLETGVAQGSTAAAGELNHLYDTTTGQISSLGNQMLKTLGLNFATQGEAINALTQLSKNPGFFQTMLGDLIAAGGAAAGAASIL